MAAALSAFSLIIRLTSIGKRPDRIMVDLLSAMISVLIVSGILQKSKRIRNLALGLAWLGVIFGGLIFFASVFAAIYTPHHNWLLIAKIMTVPLVTSGMIAWGLMTQKSKIYFGLISNEANPIRPSALRPAH
ncbi:MAG TPA: hypothetical protein VK717_02215 [Opitutaceae bacterium]|nr:hypothetical protein [Opitutaceae bacterium]